MKKLSVLLPAIVCVALLAIGGWWLYGKFDATREEIHASRTQDDSTALVAPTILPADSLSENDD